MWKTPLGRSAAIQYSQTTSYFTIYSCLCQTKAGIVYNKFNNAGPYHNSIPYFWPSVGVFTNFSYKNVVPQGDFPAGPFLGEKETNRKSYQSDSLNGENCLMDFWRGISVCSSQYHEPEDTCSWWLFGNTGQSLFLKTERKLLSAFKNRGADAPLFLWDNPIRIHPKPGDIRQSEIRWD